MLSYNAVIQHIPHSIALDVTLPELAMALAGCGVLQLMFKPGRGVATGPALPMAPPVFLEALSRTEKKKC